MSKLQNVYCCDCGAHAAYTWGEPSKDILCFACARPIAELMNYVGASNAPQLHYSNSPTEQASIDAEHEFFKAFAEYKIKGIIPSKLVKS